MTARTAAALIAGAALAAPGAAPGAEPSAGRYTGTVAGAALSFRVKGAGIRALSFDRVVARCSDGTPRGVRVRPLPARWTMPVRGGRFRKSTALGNATRLGTLLLTGRFTSASRVRGTLRHEFLHVPSGAECDTGTLSFTARRRGASGPDGGKPEILSGATEAGSALRIAVTGGTRVRPARMAARMSCTDGGSVTLDVRNPPGADAVAGGGAFSGLWRFTPPAVAGRPEPSGGAIELSGRITGAGLEGAARLTIGFEDGSSCDSDWQLFALTAG